MSKQPHKAKKSNQNLRLMEPHALLNRMLVEAMACHQLSTLVLLVMRLLLEMGRVIVVQRIERLDEPYRLRGAHVPCPRCQAAMTRDRNLREVSRLTLLGKIAYLRTRFTCTCGCNYFPVDKLLGISSLLNGHSVEFADAVVMLCTLVPFGRGCELVEKFFRIAVSTHLARSLVMAVGSNLVRLEMLRAADLWQQRHTNPFLFEPLPCNLRTMERHKRVYVMMDNSKVGIQEGKRGRGAVGIKALRKAAQEAARKRSQAIKRQGLEAVDELEALDDKDLEPDESFWRDARAILIFREEDRAQTGKKRHVILQRRVLAHVGTKEEWEQLVHMAFHEEGVYTAHEVVVVADGGSGIWELFDELLPTTSTRTVVQILDWYHAMSHLWAVGRAYKGCKTDQQRKDCAAWVRPLETLIHEGNVSNVIQRLEKLSSLSSETKKLVDKCVKYFDSHRKRMRYSFFRKHDLLIGSGAMESVHAWVIQPRCRLPGMRWSVPGVNAMLRLRCSWASGTWDEDFRRAVASPPPKPASLADPP